MPHTYDIIMSLIHAGLLGFLWKLFNQRKKDHKENTEKMRIQNYMIKQMWLEFCKNHGLSPDTNGNK